MNKEQFLLYKKLLGRIIHHQLLNEYVLHNFFTFYQTLLIVKRKQYNKLRKRKYALPSWEFALCRQLLYVILFLNKTSLSKSFCSLRLGFQRAIYDASKFFLVLVFFGAFEMTALVK